MENKKPAVILAPAPTDFLGTLDVIDLARKCDAEPDKCIDKQMDGIVEKGIAKLFKTILKETVAPFGKWYVRGFTLFYAPHIKVLSKYFDAELKYDGSWRTLNEIRRGCRTYREQMSYIMKQIPFPKEKDKKKYEDTINNKLYLLQGFDAIIRGTENLVRQINIKISEVEEYISRWPPTSSLASTKLLGVDTARNSLCEEVLELIQQNDKIVNLRNDWARLFNLPPWYPNLRKDIQKRCPSTPF